MKTILLGYDGSDGAERALERAAELAQGLHASLVVVSVAPAAHLARGVPVLDPEYAAMSALPAPGGSGAPIPLMFPEDKGRAPHEIAQHQLERARTRLAPTPIEVDYVSEVGDPAGRLLAVARERHADAIVVGSREHGFVDRLLGRHVDEEVAGHAPCDVLLVH
jgi:nucleotide-binding universal stress UspA family protein